ITPLPDEPQGEAIAYTVDGASLLTLSDVAGAAPIRRYPSTAPSPTTAPAGASSAPGSPNALGTVTASPAAVPVPPLGHALAAGGTGAVLAGALAWWLTRRRTASGPDRRRA